jgi:electron transfer flavoprotein alpha subunit
VSLCPFSAINYDGEKIEINDGCKMCRICVTKGAPGAITWEEEAFAEADKAAWRGIAVYAECSDGVLHTVSLELISKAKTLAKSTGQPVYVLLIGHETEPVGRELLRYGADRVFLYDHPAFSCFNIEPYARAFADFIERQKPSSVLVGATNIGRSLAPRVAARFRTGLTADCTALEMRENSDLVQIRPAFGGNIMAQIVTPKHRPQFCTVRPKVFSTGQSADNLSGKITAVALRPELFESSVEILAVEKRPKEIDITEAKTIVAVGRGIRKQADLLPVEELATLLGAQLACTRPLVENGWFDPRRQIGLSGRTVKADLIITLGISGSVQFAAGMRGCGCIIAVNKEPDAAIFGVAHYAAVGDLYEILPQLITCCKEVQRWDIIA